MTSSQASKVDDNRSMNMTSSIPIITADPAQAKSPVSEPTSALGSATSSVCVSEDVQPTQSPTAESFEIEADLVDIKGQTLGLKEALNAREGQNAFTKSQGRVKVVGTFNQISWGRYNGQAACLLEIGFSLSGMSALKLEHAFIGIELGSEAADDKEKQRLSGLQLFPFFTSAFDLDGSEGRPTPVEKEQNLALELGGEGAGFGGHIKTPELITKYTQLRRWTMTSYLEPTGRDAAYRRLTVDIVNDKKAQDFLPPAFKIRMIIAHDFKPFYMQPDLHIDASLKEEMRQMFTLPTISRGKRPRRMFAPLDETEELQL